MTWIQTRSGRRFDLLDPDPDSLDIGDIAHALSNICRFTGHTGQFMSVAQHSLVTAGLVPEEHRFDALMHDATEAYVGDVSRPLKQLLPDYQRIEAGVWDAICRRWGTSPVLPKEVKDADNVSLMWERRELMGQPVASWAEWVDESLLERVPGVPLVTASIERTREDFLHAFDVLGPS